ncbi:hypothetical protein CDES_01760 [Corynebacterium deserti GIMN1.010]|uniref:Uncharacterized protein n=1 Tax=Corynebacterium deserti GIMN1.010 TaxID=931089 RepID=A0A0M5INV0_9CORY|nr:type I-E CRISPR-associated endoribonuclease Cas2e [Corynebacterium deserti]ALC04818.1 hypothetical protein CDES_01760 [Corynebacterium deserti GIMN1.010]
MITVILSSPPEKLRGHLTRWLIEISPGVFVGRPTARVRDEIWDMIVSTLTNGRAVMTFPTRDNEQGFDIRVHRSQWEKTDFEGVTLMRHPITTAKGSMKAGWSTASQHRAARRRKAK